MIDSAIHRLHRQFVQELNAGMDAARTLTIPAAPANDSACTTVYSNDLWAPPLTGTVYGPTQRPRTAPRNRAERRAGMRRGRP